jgi:ATP phosphoribosyltransferase regulatory subunit
MLPAGTAAYVFEEATRRRDAEERIVERLRAADYREAMVPSADYLAPYAPHLGAGEERELYRFVDRHGDTIALRADFTIAIARHLAPRLAADGETTRLFYRGEVLRGGGRDDGNAEFYQVGAELLGAPGAEADLEIVERCSDSLEAARAGCVWIVLSSVGALETALSRLHSGSDTGALTQAIRERRVQVVAEATRGLSPEGRDQVQRLLEGGISADDPILASLGPAGEVLATVARALSARKECEVTIDLAEPRSRSYYTGFFFSVFGQGGGEPIAGGGRYDELYAAFGKPRPAVGFSLGLEALVRS